MSEIARTRLVGLDGESRHLSVWHALSAYGRERVNRCAAGTGAVTEDEDERSVALVLELCARFFDISFDDLFGDVAPRSRSGSPAGAPRSQSLGAEWLLRGLGPCLSLFSYQCLVGSGLIDRFGREVPRLARWCLEQRLVDEREYERVSASLERAGGTLARHRSIQTALESSGVDGAPSPGRRCVDGRFRIESAGEACVSVAVPAARFRATVRIPRAARRLFVPGHDVCLYMVETVVGWMPLASTLPVDASRLDDEVARWHENLLAHGPRESRRA
ncbi:MAG: hypothetical protein OEQ13_09895 [Acidobacteriota bacterium]|nr:hypothetical protein [Acidobacteriota bacterium]